MQLAIRTAFCCFFAACMLQSAAAQTGNAIAGQIRYFGGGQPVSGVTVQLSGPTPASVQTDTNGQYAFANLGADDWQIEPMKLGDWHSALTAIDGANALQAVVGLRSLDAVQRLACDANGSGAMTALDASFILQLRVGLITSLPVAQACGEWAFVPAPSPTLNQQITNPQAAPTPCQRGAIAYHPLASQAANQDFLAVLFGDCNGSWPGFAAPPTPTPTLTPTPSVAYRLHGLDFGPYLDGQSPDLGTPISEAQLLARMGIIAPYTQWIRTFGCTDGLEHAGRIAHELGLEAALGAWLSGDLAANAQQIANLIAAAQRGEADLVIVGSEVLRRGDLTPAQLRAYMDQVRAAIPSTIPVTTADTSGALLAAPDVIADSAVVLVNIYPYWEGVHISQAMCVFDAHYRDLVAAAGGKPVVISEAGWPSAGDTIGSAVPSATNANAYFLNFISWARANAVDYFYFEAFDEQWKAVKEGPQGAHWGVWDKDGLLKPGMQAVFDGQTVPDNWGGTQVDGPGTPALTFTSVPAYGSTADLVGHAAHVIPRDHRVAVYIFVGSGWWTKPTFAQPLTAIDCSGDWTTDITTGGTDELATKIAAFLLPAGVTPPQANGNASLPSVPQAVASIQVDRLP